MQWHVTGQSNCVSSELLLLWTSATPVPVPVLLWFETGFAHPRQIRDGPSASTPWSRQVDSMHAPVYWTTVMVLCALEVAMLICLPFHALQPSWSSSPTTPPLSGSPRLNTMPCSQRPAFTIIAEVSVLLFIVEKVLASEPGDGEGESWVDT